MGLMAGLSAAQAATAAGQCSARTQQADQRMLQDFATILLSRKQPRRAYERYAAADMLERSKAFGTTRETTIAQWETMTKLPTSQFDIQSIQLQGDVGVIQFHGHLRPGQGGAQVTLYLRLRCGLITEEWDHFEVQH
jgi:hypothetical protein